MTNSASTELPDRDCVSQVYLGLLDVGPTGNWLRRRIDWIAQEANGPHVLDVGSSEGILAVLLARRGTNVTGIDINADALDFARELLSKEPDEVRGRVNLIQGDFISTKQVTGLFDTVVMGNLLEDLDDPVAMLDRGLEHLRPGGRVILTVPFGVQPLEYQRRSIRLTELILLLRPRLGLESLSITDNHIRFVGRLAEDNDASWRQLDAEAVMSMTYEALEASQRNLYGMLERQGGRFDRLQQRLRQQVEAERATQRKINTTIQMNKRLEFRSKLDRLTITPLKEKVAATTKELRTRSLELRVTSRRLQTTLASTSFRVGSTLVRTGQRPLTLWKLPFRLLSLYRTRSSIPPEELPIPQESSDSESPAPEEAYPDPSEFIDFPLLPIPDAQTAGPTVAAILDTFTEYALRHEIELVLLSPRSWRLQMEKNSPACLFVESAWWGNNGVWRNRIAGYEGTEEDNPLREILAYCRSNGIPTVFWNKEDPPHFDNFIGAAREFDYVFTSDADCVPRYKEALGHDRIFVLPFAAATRIHNPSREKGWPTYPVCFAGSWLSQRYAERAEALQLLLDSALPKGLHIFDRNLTRPDYGEDYRFPDRYKGAIKGNLTYEEMLTAYRCYDVMLNVNTISDSPTMFARRVFESLACGTPVISSESVGMSRMLGDHVRVAHSEEEAAGHLEGLLDDEEARVREGHLAYRFIHENHTYRHRMNEVFNRVGLEPLVSEQPPVSVLMPTMRPQNVARCIENFSRQEYQNKELILILNNAEFDVDAIRREVEAIPNAQVIHVEGRTTLGDSLNLGVEAAAGEYIAKMDDDDFYGDRHLSDSVLAAKFSGAEIVGKGMYFVYFEAANTTTLRETTPDHTFASSTVASSTTIIQTDVIKDLSFASLSRSEDTNLQRAAGKIGCRIYSADRFNYLCVRKRQVSSHSWQISDAEFLEKCRNQTPGLDLDRVMI